MLHNKRDFSKFFLKKSKAFLIFTLRDRAFWPDSGWTEKSDWDAFDFCHNMQRIGVKTLICTDISRDGAMKGANRELYRELSSKFAIDLIASGGVSSMEDVTALAEMKLHGAIIGKAYYIGAVDLKRAVEAAK